MMSTDRIRSGSSVTELLRSLSVPAAKAACKAAGGGVSAQARLQGNVPGIATLRRDLALLVAGVDLESETAVRALRRPVVRRILLCEFGEAALDIPEFPAMLDSVESAMNADPAAASNFLSMLRQLQQEDPA